jgi:hypothetical protein
MYGILNTTIPMMAKTFELRHESNRLLPPDIPPELYVMLSIRCGAATIASTQTIGEVHDVDRYWGDRVADTAPSPVQTVPSAASGSE